MLTLHKIPLDTLIAILQDLWDTGADFVDISGENSKEGEQLKDTIKITIKPEYLSDHNEEDVMELEQEIEMDYSGEDDDDVDSSTTGLSEEDINDLI
jgi:hypothetical protein